MWRCHRVRGKVWHNPAAYGSMSCRVFKRGTKNYIDFFGQKSIASKEIYVFFYNQDGVELSKIGHYFRKQ